MLFSKRKFYFLLILSLKAFSGAAQCYGEQFPIVAWYSVDAEHNIHAQYRQMAEAGFNLSLSTFLTKQEVIKGLHEARGTGVKLIVDCQESRNADISFIKEVRDNPSLGLYYLCDEPKQDYFNNLSAKVNRIKTEDSVHSAYINLFPIYANNEQMKAASYDDYIDTYINRIHTPILSYDHYPFFRNIFRVDFYDNLEMVSRKCREAKVHFWGFARSYYSNDYYKIDEGRLRLQVFANMAYGAQGIQYFTYGVPKGGKSAIVDTLYQKTGLYEVVKRINREVQVVGKYSLGADFKNIFHLDKENGRLRLLENIDIIQHSGDSLLISTFEKNGFKYLMFVNKDFLNSQMIYVSFKNRVRLVNRRGRWTLARLHFKKKIDAGGWLLFQMN